MNSKSIQEKNGRYKRLSIIFNHLLFPLFCILFLVCYYLSARDLPYLSIAYPGIIAILLIAIIVWDVIAVVKKFSTVQHEEKQKNVEKNSIRGVVVYLATIIYVILLTYLGFVIATLLYLPFIIYYLGDRGIKNILSFVLIVFVVLYGLFVIVLNLNLPTGIFF